MDSAVHRSRCQQYGVGDHIVKVTAIPPARSTSGEAS